MKKLVSILMMGVLAFSISACGGNESKPTPSEPPTQEGEAPTTKPEGDKTTQLKMGMITDLGGVNDQAFNQSAWEGMELAKKDLGIEVGYLESNTDADYEPNIETMVDNDNDVIIGVGFKMDNAIKEAAENYPEQQFAIIDYAYNPEIPNVTGILFNQKDAAFLVGLIAGKMSETQKIGFINGMDMEVMNQFGYGFYAGVYTANPNALILGQYADTFADPAKGKAIANQMYSNECDIIFVAAGDTGNGVIEAAREKNKWVIGVDRDQSYLAPDNVLTSAMKRVDVGVFELGKKLKEGTLKGGETIVYGLESGAVGIAPTSDVHVPEDVLKYVEEMKAKVISGEIKVPGNDAEYKELFPNNFFMK